MQHSIIVAGLDKAQRNVAVAAAADTAWDVFTCDSLVQLQESIHEGSVDVVILDMDTLPVDNRFFRELKKTCPALSILVLSDKTFHPELQESISSHIHACLLKPVDPEELGFWLRSIHGDGTTRGSPHSSPLN